MYQIWIKQLLILYLIFQAALPNYDKFLWSTGGQPGLPALRGWPPSRSRCFVDAIPWPSPHARHLRFGIFRRFPMVNENDLRLCLWLIILELVLILLRIRCYARIGLFSRFLKSDEFFFFRLFYLKYLK